MDGSYLLVHVVAGDTVECIREIKEENPAVLG